MTGLFVKVMFLLVLNMLGGAAGAYFGRNIRSLGAWIGAALGFVFGTIAVLMLASVNPLAGVVLMVAWSFLSGLVIAPALQRYKETLGWHTVMLAFLGTGGVMAVCGAVGALSGIDFSFLSGILMFALLGLIIFGIVSIFVKMSRTVSIVEAIVGMVVFAGYFIFDFFRLSKSEDTWANAVGLSMNLYLDFLNFLLYLLQFLEKSKESASIDTIHNTAVAFVNHGQVLLSSVGLC